MKKFIKYKRNDFSDRRGSVKDPCWNGKKHTCCNVKYYWYHKISCPVGGRLENDSLS